MFISVNAAEQIAQRKVQQFNIPAKTAADRHAGPDIEGNVVETGLVAQQPEQPERVETLGQLALERDLIERVAVSRDADRLGRRLQGVLPLETGHGAEVRNLEGKRRVVDADLKDGVHVGETLRLDRDQAHGSECNVLKTFAFAAHEERQQQECGQEYSGYMLHLVFCLQLTYKDKKNLSIFAHRFNMRKVYIETYGCQMNVADTEVVFSILGREGYIRTEEIGEADVILANTCSIRDNAEQRILGRIGQFNQYRKARPDVVVGILGCMAERMKETLLESGKVDVVAGPDAYRNLPALLAAASQGHPQIDVLLSREETYGDIAPVRVDKNGVSAFISIMRGCNNVCSYCVVPYTRGAERSRDFHTIVREACDCAQQGYKEITLLGQNVDSYHFGDYDFARLLTLVAESVPGLRVRFSTSNPQDISDAVIETMAAHANICRHIHLPVQSGSDRMLEKMRRRYTRAWYLDRVAKIRALMPDCAITTDVIAGFCSETEEDHRDTLSLFEEVGFDAAFMFQYSERPGTLAARKYPDDVAPDVKTRRLEEIIAVQNRLSLESNRRDVGKTFRVLVEGPSKRNAAELCGRNGQNKMCVWPDAEHRAGDFVDIRVKDCTQATLFCELA